MNFCGGMLQSNRIWKPVLWDNRGHLQLWKKKKVKALTAKLDEGRVGEKEEGKRRKERRSSRSEACDKEDPVGERSEERAPSPLHFYQEQVLILNKFLIAPACNYLLLWLFRFCLHKRHTWRLISSFWAALWSVLITRACPPQKHGQWPTKGFWAPRCLLHFPRWSLKSICLKH